jgi:uncharacterized cofD-like protein
MKLKLAKSKIKSGPLNLVVMGGGTGSFTLLQELKKLTPNITALVNMSDDGGSTGRLRDEFGALPPGDIRQCLVALSNSPDARDIFDYRVGGSGSLAGHSLGNIILAALEQKYGSFDKAVKAASRLLNITGTVVPITLDKHRLVLHDGQAVVVGQAAISQADIRNRDAFLELKPVARINTAARNALLMADIVVMAPGRLHGSLLPLCVVQGVGEVFQNIKAKKVLISNLVNKTGQTDSWHVVDYVREFERYLGPKAFDVVLYNNIEPSADLLAKYAADGDYPVDFSQSRFKEISAKTYGAALVADKIYAQDPNDTAIQRTLIRHNAQEVTRQLAKLI